jgi:hypothetical protein
MVTSGKFFSVFTPARKDLERAELCICGELLEVLRMPRRRPQLTAGHSPPFNAETIEGHYIHVRNVMLGQMRRLHMVRPRLSQSQQMAKNFSWISFIALTILYNLYVLGHFTTLLAEVNSVE